MPSDPIPPWPLFWVNWFGCILYRWVPSTGRFTSIQRNCIVRFGVGRRS